MAAQNDPYEVLGVSKTATQAEIKERYRNLAKKFHPDLNPGNKESEKKFKDISLAYERVGNPESRAQFDRGEAEAAQERESFSRRQRPFYHQTQQGMGGGAPGGGRYTFSFGEGMDEDLLRSIFGDSTREEFSDRKTSQASRGPLQEDQVYLLRVSLRDSVLGAEKDITLPNGKKLRVTLPKGVNSGTRLKFAGLGTLKQGYDMPSDIYVEIQVEPDERFTQVNDDLFMDLPISLYEAVFGGEVRVPTLGGEVLLKIPPHVNSGKRLRLPGKGTFNRSTGHVGDQILVLQVMLPEKLSLEQESTLRQWQDRFFYNPREQDSQKKGAA